MKISARNVFEGTVKHITAGVVNSEVVITLPGGHEIVSIITKAFCENMALREGMKVLAVIKASSVMLAVE